MDDSLNRAANDPQADEERLAHALITRGLLTRSELQKARAGDKDPPGPEPLLNRLVKEGYLTRYQARRALKDLQVLLNQQIPGYQLMEKLGAGAMGIVYKALQTSMNRLVAVKILNPKHVTNTDFIERFTREAHLAAKFSSNNVVQAIDVGSAGPLHYFVMEYVEGTTIKDELEKGKVYTEAEAVDIVLQIAQALRQAHKRNLIHRDVKPANVMLTPEGIAKLADLGIARDTNDKVLARAEKGVTIGTPYYISPEQILGKEDIDIRADIYSLGATLYHMVTGQPPFQGTIGAVLTAHLKQELTPPDHLNTDLSSGLGEVVEFMMAKDRGARYQTPEDLIVDLECLLNGDPPKLARERMNLANLKELAEGEADEDDRDDEPPPLWQRGVPLVYVVAVGGLLCLSLLANLGLLLRR